MEEQKRERHTRRHPVRAFFRGMYTEVAFSGESLRINGWGLLFGLVVGTVVGGLGWLVRPSVGGGEPPAGGHRMGDVPAAPGRLAEWCGCTAGADQTTGGTDLIIQAARGEQPVSRLLAPVIFAATLLTHGFGGSMRRRGGLQARGGSLAELVRKGGKLGAEFQDLAIMCGMSAGFLWSSQPDYRGAGFAGNLLVGIPPPGAFSAWSPSGRGQWPRPARALPCAFISPPPPPTCCSMDRCWCWGLPAAC